MHAAHAVAVDGERLIGQYRPDPSSKNRCLGELDPDGFIPFRSVCPSPVQDWDSVLPSPDGRWWVVTSRDGIALYEAETVWHGAVPARTLLRPDEGCGVAWIDGETFVVATAFSSTIVHTDGRPDEVVPLGVGLGGEVAQSGVVVDLR